jgi:hypothetical protein
MRIFCRFMRVFRRGLEKSGCRRWFFDGEVVVNCVKSWFVDVRFRVLKHATLLENISLEIERLSLEF